MKVEFDGRITQCHKRLHKILKGMGFQVVDNYEADQYRIDCFVTELNKGFEADGKGYHWKNRDAKRDEYILNKFGIPIMRIPEALLNGRSDERVRELIREFVETEDLRLKGANYDIQREN